MTRQKYSASYVIFSGLVVLLSAISLYQDNYESKLQAVFVAAAFIKKSSAVLSSFINWYYGKTTDVRVSKFDMCCGIIICNICLMLFKEKSPSYSYSTIYWTCFILGWALTVLHLIDAINVSCDKEDRESHSIFKEFIKCVKSTNTKVESTNTKVETEKFEKLD